MTIEERAKGLLEPMARGEYSLDEAYIKGATDQQKIDIEKACEWYRNENSHDVKEWLDWKCEKLRKAMEE